MLKSSWSASNTKDSTNGQKPIKTLKIQRLDSCVRKHGGSDIDWFNFCGNQTTHFVNCIESLNVPNLSCNHKKTSNTFEVGPIMCVSFATEGKTQVRWATIVGRKAQNELMQTTRLPKELPIVY
jgi:hypothetical protein